jgi:hypothetical protein
MKTWAWIRILQIRKRNTGLPVLSYCDTVGTGTQHKPFIPEPTSWDLCAVRLCLAKGWAMGFDS